MKDALRPTVLLGITRRAVFCALTMVAIYGCASVPNPDPRDPWESFNRGVFQFNETADRVVIKPVATAYRDVTPALVRTGVGNFFSNLDDAWSFVNSLLQAKPVNAASSFMRVAVNTFMGIGGIFDVASEMRLERQKEDFGQTLGRWGVASGPYLVLPLLGPSTLRDTFALPVDMRGDIVMNIDYVPTRNSLKALDLIDTRASLLTLSATLDEVALDKYSFTRDAFLQRRISAVFDGSPPQSDLDGKPLAR
ncbi:MAG: VacJ family lipoprotein [Burkholderiaceae bacterium]